MQWCIVFNSRYASSRLWLFVLCPLRNRDFLIRSRCYTCFLPLHNLFFFHRSSPSLLQNLRQSNSVHFSPSLMSIDSSECKAQFCPVLRIHGRDDNGTLVYLVIFENFLFSFLQASLMLCQKNLHRKVSVP